MDLSRFPRRRYTVGPTPLEYLPNFSAALAAACPGGEGPAVWIKRDDMLGLFPGGNKTRKLEFLVADALAQGADTLITCGAPQSNHCRITLTAAAREGLRCRFVIDRCKRSFDRLGIRALLAQLPGQHPLPARVRSQTAFDPGLRKGLVVQQPGRSQLIDNLVYRCLVHPGAFQPLPNFAHGPWTIFQ